MLEIVMDMANVAFVVGVASIYAGISSYKNDSQAWKTMSAPMAIFGVYGVAYSISVYMNSTMGIVAFLLLGTVTCYALFIAGHENQ